MAHLTLNEDGSLIASTNKKKKKAQLSISNDGQLTTNNSSNNINAKKQSHLDLLDDGWQFGDLTKMFLGEAKQGLDNFTKTTVNTGANIAYGTAQGLEKTHDTLSDISSKVNLGLEKLVGLKTQKEYDEAREKERNRIAKNYVNDFVNESGLSKTWDNIENGSVITRDNLGGKIAQGIGEMLPTIAVGKIAGVSAPKLTSLKGLSGTQKATTLLKNVGKTAITQLPANTTLAMSSYGGALEEAYRNGATDDEAMKYALGSTATELATEWITGGIPGVNDKGLLDSLQDKALDKVSNSLAKFLIKSGYSVIGEGTEEALSEMINPILKNATYSQGEKVDWNAVVESAIVGGITGGILNTPANISNYRTDINANKLKQQQISNQVTQNFIEQNNLKPTQINKNEISLPKIDTNQEVNVQQNLEKLSTKQKKNSATADNILMNPIQTSETNNGTSSQNGIPELQLLNNTISDKNNTINKNQSQIAPIKLEAQIDNALSNNKSKNKSYLGKVTNNISTKIKSLLGVDVRGRVHILLDNDIRHMINNHGNENIEKARNQLPITKEDIKNIPYILDNPDDIIKGSSNKEGASIRYIKTFNDATSYVVEIVPEESKYLKIKTMWKVPTTLTHASNNNSTLRYTSKTEGGNSISTSVDNNTTNSTKSQIAPLPSQYSMQQNVENDTKIPSSKEFIPKNPTKESTYDDFKEEKRTRKEVQAELKQEMGITVDDIQVGKDINSIDFQRTDPIRVNEKVFGYEVGKKINDATVNKTKHNEAERTRFLNKERNEIKDLGIKARSKESAAVQKYGEKQYINQYDELVKYGDKELAQEFSNIETQNRIKNAAKVIREKYDTYIDKINSVITELGYDPIPKRPDYMRHFQELDDKLSKWGIPLNPTDLNKDNIPTDINGLTDQFKPGKNWFASAMARKGLKTTYDAITGIDGYLEGASNLMYHTEDIQRYRTLSKFIRETYGQTHGLDNIENMTEEQKQQRIDDVYNNKLSKYVAWLDEQANALAGKKGGIDRAAERILGRKIYSVLDTAKKQVGSNMTGFNVRSALTNFASSVQGASKTNKLAFVKGTISTVQNIIHNDGLIDKSDFLTSRFGSEQLSKKLWQKASNAGQILMSGSDYFTANQIWRSKYFENLQKGMNETEAIKKADEFSSRIMGDRSKGSTAEIFNSKTLGLLTQFQLEVNNQWSSLVHDNKMDIQSGNKSGATVLFQLGQLAAMSYMFNNFMRALTGSDVMIDPIDMLKKIIGSDDDDEEKTLEERAQEVLGDLVNDLPFASTLTGGRIPISEAFTGANTLFKKVTGGTDNYGNEIKWEDVKDDVISSAFYWLLPTGYGQLKKTTKSVSMYNEDNPIPGSYTASGNLRFNADTSTGGKIKAALFGEYSSSEAQKYIDSGFKAISKSRLQEMEDLEMSASEYRKYRSELSASGTTNAEKVEYIANSNYSDKQKNIMAKDLLDRDFNIKEYEKYDSYEEYDYAYKYPEKYAVVSQITSFDKYNTYKEKLDDIRANTTDDKMETIKYINSLNLSVPQKAMFIKMYYPSFDNYDKQIINYVNSQNMTVAEKTEILEDLGFTVKNGRVY